MLPITESLIDTAAPNADAAKNGRALVLKNKFIALHRSADDSLLFGACQGSGIDAYQCSADFAAPTAPVYRCNCPSRQFPCKHSLGLMYAYVQGKNFSVAEVPADLAAKRDKAAARVEKKKEAVDAPRTVNKAALAKKIKAQLVGIDLLEKLTQDLVRLGIGNTNAKTAREIEDQAKQLGNAYLPGAQAALHRYTQLFHRDDGEDMSSTEREAGYSDALDQLGRLSALIKQGRVYLSRRLDDPELAAETDSPIAAWLGHAWQLRELKEAGLVEQQVELLQLAFNTHDDTARQEYVDTGIWMDLGKGVIHLTQNFRPYRATKYIKSDDSLFDVAQIPQLAIYPGGLNRRVRWESMQPRPQTAVDRGRVRSFGQADFAAAIKQIKGEIKAPLADKQPVVALNYQRLGQVGDALVAEDAAGQRLAFTDRGLTDEPPSCHLLPLLPADVLAQPQTLIARFRHDLDSRRLQIKPLAIVTEHQIIRLTL